MGGAFIAVADDGSAASWNPAGIAVLERPEASVVWKASDRQVFDHAPFLFIAVRGLPSGTDRMSQLMCPRNAAWCIVIAFAVAKHLEVRIDGGAERELSAR